MSVESEMQLFGNTERKKSSIFYRKRLLYYFFIYSSVAGLMQRLQNLLLDCQIFYKHFG